MKPRFAGPYDEHADSAKCGGLSATTGYHADGCGSGACSSNCPAYGCTVAHMRRRCLRCGHTWLERPLDAEAGDCLGGNDAQVP